MSTSKTIKGLSLKVGPLGENDRLLTLLSHEEGVIRIAIPGARRPKSRLASTSALTYLEIQISGKSSLRRATQVKVLQSFNRLGERIETLSAAQSLSELTLLLVGSNDPQPNMLNAVLIHLERMQKPEIKALEVLAICVQSCIHMLALGGYGIPVQRCCKTGNELIPPIGNWDWRCSLIANEGFFIGESQNSDLLLNASELALLQRLLKPQIPRNKKGELLGPLKVWINLLQVVEIWVEAHLNRTLNSLHMLKESLNANKNI